MEGEYGKSKGKSVFYASKNSGKISGVDSANCYDSLCGMFKDSGAKSPAKDQAGGFGMGADCYGALCKMFGGAAKDALPMRLGPSRQISPLRAKPTTALKAVTQPNGMKVEYHPPQQKKPSVLDAALFGRGSMAGSTKV